jgi:peptide subunit release factor RF-3
VSGVSSVFLPSLEPHKLQGLRAKLWRGYGPIITFVNKLDREGRDPFDLPMMI